MSRTKVSRKVFSCGLLLSAWLSPQVCAADWQYTSWGDAPDQVVAAGPDMADLKLSATGSDTPFGRVMINGSYAAMGLHGYVSFAFHEDRLSGVIFRFAGKDSASVLMMLQDQYGAPDMEPTAIRGPEQIWFWRDEASGNNVRYIHVPASLEPDALVYTPISSGDLSGL